MLLLKCPSFPSMNTTYFSVCIYFLLYIVHHHLVFTSYDFLKALRVNIAKTKNTAYKEMEYPGKDSQKINLIKKSWQEYYECLHNFSLDISTAKSVTPESIMVFEGTLARLYCNVCTVPSETEANHVNWYYRELSSQVMSLIDEEEYITISGEGKLLYIYALGREISGHYICKYRNRIYNAYFLEVADISEPTVLVKPETTNTGLHGLPEMQLNGTIRLFTKWGLWSDCSECEKVGTQVKFGICTITLQHSINDATTNQHSEIPGISPVSSLVPLLKLFKNGVPCRSYLLGGITKAISVIQNRTSEIMVRYCKVQCQSSLTKNVNNKTMREKISEGFLNLRQKLPSSVISWQTIYASTSSDVVILKCPGYISSDAPVIWRIGSKRIYSRLIKNQTHGRIEIDVRSNIIIRNPHYSDSKTYSCWRANKRAGRIRLVINKPMAFSINHHTVLLGLTAIFGTFIFVFYRATRRSTTALN